MKVIVACEESQRVTIAFRNKGHEAYSCDILPCSGGYPEWHIQSDVLKIINDGWDLMVAHPPCTFLAVSGARWLYDERYPNRKKDQEDAIEFFLALYNAPIPKIAIENPIGIISSVFRKPDQIIQPYYFGDEAQKATCLWLKNLPKLRYGKEVQIAFGENIPPQSDIVGKGEMHITKSGKKLPKWYSLLGVNEDRQRLRSVTFQGFANAMAEQWG
jgi:hypothetical protein